MSDDKIERIKAAFARDQREQPRATKAGDIPISYEAITPEWLTAVLCRENPGAVVTGLRLGEVDSGTSNRRRIHIDYNQAGIDAGLPRSVFCKATHDLANRILLSAAATFSEVSFYNRIRDQLDIDAPRAYLAAYDPESWASIIMLHDMQDVTFCSDKTAMDRASVESQMELLAKMHGHFYDSPQFRGDLSDLVTFGGRFRRLVDLHGFKKCCEDGVRAAESVVPPRLYARQDEIWAATERAVARLSKLPETFTHNDVHLKNWYMRERPAMGLGDWQVSCRGQWSRDVAYTISTALTTEDRRVLERDLIRFYLDRLHAFGGPKVSFDDAWSEYREQMVSTLAWWTMTLTPSPDMPDMQPLDITYAFIGRITAAMDDLDVLDID